MSVKFETKKLNLTMVNSTQLNFIKDHFLKLTSDSMFLKI